MREQFQDLANFTANRMQWRYLVALSLIALLTLLSQWVIQSSTAEQEYDSHVVNLAGRQRMLSQKITKTCYYLIGAESAEKRRGYRQELSESLALWELAHDGLRKGDKELDLPGGNSAQVAALFAAIEPHRLAIAAAAKEILAAPDDPSLLTAVAQRIRDSEPDYLREMDAIVFRFDSEAKERVGFTRRLELALAALTLLVLVLEARFIFAPAVRLLRRNVHELEQREADMEKLFSTSPTAMFLVDGNDLNIARANNKAEALMGCPSDDFVQRSIRDFLDVQHETNRHFLEGLHVRDSLDEYEVLLIDAKHSFVEALASSCRVVFEGRPVFAISITNITELKKAQQTLQYYATFDEMTGMVNRRTGLLLLGKEVERSRRDGTPLAVCYADLDGLKTANDRYGHHEGDWMIRTTAQVFLDSIRKGDVAVRLGGDEFLLVLHDCTEDKARLLLERIEKRLREIDASEAKAFTLSLSFGLAVYDAARHARAEELIAEADGKMYEAKRNKKAQRAD